MGSTATDLGDPNGLLIQVCDDGSISIVEVRCAGGAAGAEDGAALDVRKAATQQSTSLTMPLVREAVEGALAGMKRPPASSFTFDARDAVGTPGARQLQLSGSNGGALPLLADMGGPCGAEGDSDLDVSDLFNPDDLETLDTMVALSNMEPPYMSLPTSSSPPLDGNAEPFTPMFPLQIDLLRHASDSGTSNHPSAQSTVGHQSETEGTPTHEEGGLAARMRTPEAQAARSSSSPGRMGSLPPSQAGGDSPIETAHTPGGMSVDRMMHGGVGGGSGGALPNSNYMPPASCLPVSSYVGVADVMCSAPGMYPPHVDMIMHLGVPAAKGALPRGANLPSRARAFPAQNGLPCSSYC